MEFLPELCYDFTVRWQLCCPPSQTLLNFSSSIHVEFRVAVFLYFKAWTTVKLLRALTKGGPSVLQESLIPTQQDGYQSAKESPIPLPSVLPTTTAACAGLYSEKQCSYQHSLHLEDWSEYQLKLTKPCRSCSSVFLLGAFYHCH